jgi:hypothetical protein
VQVYELRTRLMTEGVFPAIRTQNEVIRKRLYLIRCSQARMIFQRNLKGALTRTLDT